MRRRIAGLVAVLCSVLVGGQVAYASPVPPEPPGRPTAACPDRPPAKDAPTPGPGRQVKRTIEGTVRLLALDPQGCGSPEERLVLVSGTTSYKLEGSGAAAARPNTRMRVSGLLSGTRLTVDQATTIGAAPGTLATTGTTRVLVMLATWTQPDSVTPESARAQIFGQDNDWFREASYSSLGQTGDVTPWLPIAGPAGGQCLTDSESTMAQAKSAAAAEGFDVPSYDNFILYFPNNSSVPGDDCAGIAGFAYIGAPGTWINGYLDLRVTVHEAGHNYGLHHANSYFCDSADLGGNCSFREYGDPYDAMGFGFEHVGHFNAFEKDRLEWFDNRTPVADLTAGGTRTLIPLESSETGLSAIKVIASADRTYWLEYRQPLGFDGGLPFQATSGVLVHVIDERIIGNGLATNLVDAYPNSGPQSEFLQIRANTFWRTPEGYKFSVGAVTWAGAVVTVSYQPGPPEGTYRPLTQTRILDTRSGLGASKKIVPAGGRVDLTVLGRGGVPASGVGSVLINLTVTQGRRGGYATAFPAGVAQPAASTLNFPANRSVANSVVVKVGSGGKVTLSTSATAHLIADVQGYFESGADLVALTPTRLLDTRTGVGAPAGIVTPSAPVDLQVLGVGGVPSTGVTSVIINVTATRGVAPGIVTVYPPEVPDPGTATVSYATSQSVATGTVAMIGANGKIRLQVSENVHVVVDLQGYLRSDFVVTPIVPQRAADTTEHGPLGIGEYEFYVSGFGALPEDGVEAVVLNITATPRGRGGVLTVFPGGWAQPNTSTLNFPPSTRTSNYTIVKIGFERTAVFVVTAPADLTVDVVGYVPRGG